MRPCIAHHDHFSFHMLYKLKSVPQISPRSQSEQQVVSCLDFTRFSLSTNLRGIKVLTVGSRSYLRRHLILYLKCSLCCNFFGIHSYPSSSSPLL